MKISLYPMFLLLLLATTSWGQGFVKNYPPASSVFQAAVLTSDGGYFLAGNTVSDNSLFLQRVDLNGTVLWANHLSMNGAHAIAACAAPDSGFIVLADYYATAEGFRNIVLKISNSGTVVWQTQINNTLLANGLRDIIYTADGHILAAGDTRNAQLQQNIWLVKLNKNGTQVWSKSVGDSTYNEQVSRLLQLPNGHVIISGAGLHGADRDLFLTKTDSAGNLIWEKWYAQPYTQNAHDLVQLSDGGLAVLADVYGEEPAKLAILRTDGDGVLDFFQKSSIGLSAAPGAPLNTISSFATDAADNFYIPIGSADAAVLRKLDAFGDFVWAKNLFVSGLPQQIINSSGHFAIVGGNNANQGAFLIKTDEAGDIYTNRLTGNIFHDENQNCVSDGGELPLSQFIVHAQNQSNDEFYQSVAADGSFNLLVSNGDFTIEVAPHYGTENFWTICNPQTVMVGGSYQTVAVPPLGLYSTVDCPLLDVEIGTAAFRRCTTSVFNVNYCNNGNTTATNAAVVVSLDPKISYQSSTIPLTSQSSGVLTFDVADVLPGACGSFNITVLVDCSAEIGEVLCTEAHIFPDSSCAPIDLNWDGSSLVVSGTCNGDVQFNIRNIGTGDMTGQADYVIMEDQIMYMQGKTQLHATEDTTITVPNPAGHTYQLLAEQRAGHPGRDRPSAFVQQCGGGNPANFALQFPQNDADLFVASYCDQVVGSFDPNDKRGFPLGWQAAHFIEPDQELAYMIRFQNTGNDTAFQVIVRDTISALLDVASLRAGASSHPYTYTVSGPGVVTFTFSNILLPDSNVNEVASHGYVMFRLRQRAGLVQGDVIRNQAAIYFDFNLPVITNSTFHTIGYPLISATVDRPAAQGLNLQVFPNPAAEQVTFQVGGVPADSRFQLALFNAQGLRLRQEQFTGINFNFQRNGLVPGVYFFQLEEKNGRIARGKIIIR